MLRQHTLRTRLWISCGLLCGLMLITSWLMPCQTSAQALPPRPTPVSTITPTALPSVHVREGGLLELYTHPTQLGVWTLIQWQDALGSWHDVAGWQGTLDGTSQLWWVAPRDLGKGPFRWLVYQSRGGLLLATSQPFALPRFNGATVRIDVALVP
jgi:hypothetical protein